MTRKLPTLKDIEKRHDTQSIMLADDYVWPLIRLKINEELRAKEGLKSRVIKINALLVFKLLKTIFYGIYEIFNLGTYDYWIFSSSERRKRIGENYVDRVLGTISDEFPKSLIIENPYPHYGHFKKKVVNDRHIISRILFFMGVKVFALFVSNTFKITNEDNLKTILKTYGLQFKYRAVLKNHLAQYRFMTFLLKFGKPKAAIFVYSASSMGLIKAFKAHKIPVVEIQHGVVNDSHYAYNLFKDFGKTLFPDYLCTYGYKEKELFGSKNHFIAKENVFPVGYYYLDKFVNSHNNDAYRQNIKRDFKKIIVVSLQDPFEEFMFEFLRKTALLDPALFYVLVPRYNTKEYDGSLFEINMVIERDLNVYECLQIADFHTTINSTCAIESLYFGVPNILFDYNNWATEYYQEILNDEKHTTYVKTPSEFLNTIKEHEFDKRKTIIEKSNVFIKPNFIENFRDIMENVILAEVK